MSLKPADTVTLQVDGDTITARVEDGSKGDVILAKIITGNAKYQPDSVHEFDRKLIAG